MANSLSLDEISGLLTRGEIEAEGLIPWSSNAILLVTVRGGDGQTRAIYKPQRGERPLWDFEAGTLGKREVAAYLVSRALGWELVPPTVLREGPYGLGSLQWFVDAQEDEHFFTIRDRPGYAARLRQLAAFDVITNNADRKSGHCLLDQTGHLWAIDNALTFHVEPKLRTVIWDYAGQPLPGPARRSLEALGEALRLGSALSQELQRLLSPDEMDALRRRVRRFVRAGRYPQPGPGPAVPWPLV